jgi:L-alanine-DL-glutamate epimerase-like enolase superfamily enzyme
MRCSSSVRLSSAVARPMGTTVSRITSSAYTIPTDQPEADGTLSWDHTTVVIVEISAADESGIGWTYASSACRAIVDDVLAPCVCGSDVLDTAATHEAMVRACRNLGRPGVVSCAISAVDIALWDLKAKFLGVALADLFGRYRSSAPVYGSGGFTTYDDTTTRTQLEHWSAELSIPRVKIKVGESWGSNEKRDLARVVHARQAIGEGVELFVDANGGYSAKQAITIGRHFVEAAGVCWFEEPVSSDDLAGLRLIKEILNLDVAAGEYGFDEFYFERMLCAGAVDCLQVDVTRCGGYTSWLRVAAVAHAHAVDVSAHCAPNLHAHVATSVPNLRHVEYFWDHERIESLLFDGALSPLGGSMTPDRDRPGHGLVLKRPDAAPYEV